MKLTLHISPCPNDTFMFDALINNRIDTGGLQFDVQFLDIEQLNARVRDTSGAPDISKMSYAALPAILDRYRPLDAGSALGRGNGPVLVTREESLRFGRVAVPGRLTTANRLLALFYPEITDKPEYLFSEVAGAVERGEVDAGVLIHEGRFTYRQRSLHLVADLGEQWEAATDMPLPLGAIVTSRALPVQVRQGVEELVRHSVEYALAHPGASYAFVREHAREMDDQVIGQHIQMFVNDRSVSLGAEGRAAVARLLDEDENTIFG